MRISSLLGLTILLSTAPQTAFAETLSSGIPVINDIAFINSFEKKLEQQLEVAIEGKALTEQYNTTTGKKLAVTVPSVSKNPASVFTRSVDAVGVIASIYLCDKCEHWHRGPAATCWAASTDGVFVTNAHVFHSAEKRRAFGVNLRDGTVLPVTEILAVDPDADIAVFQVAVGETKLSPLPVGKDAEIGATVHVISHPDGNFYTYTRGYVSRYFHMKRPRNAATTPIFMGVTADYAKGSSGGPLLDDAGAVIGMVSSTSSIYYGSPEGKNDKGPLQMTLHNCVPGFAIRSVLYGEKAE